MKNYNKRQSQDKDKRREGRKAVTWTNTRTANQVDVSRDDAVIDKLKSRISTMVHPNIIHGRRLMPNG